jgi:hypothetical protein
MAEDYELPERLVTEALLKNLNAGKVGTQAQQAYAEAALRRVLLLLLLQLHMPTLLLLCLFHSCLWWREAFGV